MRSGPPWGDSRSVRLLLPSDPLNARTPDLAFEAEVDAIERVGIPIDLLDLEVLLAGAAARAVRRVGEGDGPLLYRGWMMPIDRYAGLAAALGDRGVSLITSPESYAATHHLPLTYAALAGLTPRTVWVEGTDGVDFERVHEVLRQFGSAPLVVKDFVKSRKHEWLEACYMPDASDRAGVERVLGTFVERQGDDLAGGIVLREFVELRQVGTHPVSGLPLGREYRLFFVNGGLLVGGRYWDGVDYADDYPLGPFERLATMIPSRFFAMDIAQTAAGDWIVMEVGDGQVSSIPESIDPTDFYTRLTALL